MIKFIKASALTMALALLFVGCSTTDSPVSPESKQAVAPGSGNNNQAVLERARQAFAEAEAEAEKNLRLLPGFGQKVKSAFPVDYDHTNEYQVYSDDYGWYYQFSQDVTDYWYPANSVQYQRFYLYIQNWDELIPDHSVIIPMSEETYNTFFDGSFPNGYGQYFYSYNCTYSFVENDGATGLTGLKVELGGYNFIEMYTHRLAVKPEYWINYGYDPDFYANYYPPNWFPESTEGYWTRNVGGDLEQLGPHRLFSTEFEVATYTLSGMVFYDLNGNGTQDGGEPGISGANVSLTDVGSTTSDGDGNYSFADVEGGIYTVSCDAISGFSATTATSAEVDLSADSEVDFGFAIDFESFGGSSANSHGMGWWKHNIGRAAASNARGVQISAAACEALRASLANFSFAALNFGSLADAYTALDYNGGIAASRLAQHLTASEYNYANGAYLDGDAQLTWAFVVWGEYLVENSGSFTNAELNAAKDLFEDYNEGLIQ